jgi:formate dehydrogenase major subunit
VQVVGRSNRPAPTREVTSLDVASFVCRNILCSIFYIPVPFDAFHPTTYTHPAFPIDLEVSPMSASFARGFLRNLVVLPGRPEPTSAESIEKTPRTAGAAVFRSVCPYCAVGCGQLIHARDGKIINIEGDPDSPINEGTLCPKGAATFQFVVNPLRQTTCLYRRPKSDRWEQVTLDWAMERIAQKVKATRDDTFVERLPNGRTVNHCLGIATLGGATLEIEENYLIKKLFNGGLGILSIENQARI